MAEQTDNEDVDDAVALAHRLYKAARDHSSTWREEARTAYDMVAGDQWDDEDETKLKAQNRPAVVFNQIMRVVEAVVGTQISNRQETRFIPREQGDVEVNEILTAGADWVRDQCDAEDEETDAFEDMIVCGMGWTETRLDYDHDPDGMIYVDRVDPLEMYWDPGAKKRNLSDSLWFMRIKEMSKTDFMREYPDADVTSATVPWDSPAEDLNTRTHVYPQDAYKEQQGPSGSERNVVRIAHMQWAEFRPIYRVGKKATRMAPDKYEKVKEDLDRMGMRSLKQREMVWKEVFIAGNQTLGEVTDCPFPDGSTFRCMTGKRNRNKNTWYGIVSAMIDPQRWGNKFFSQILDIINKNSKGGVFVETDAVDDIREFEENYARPDAAQKVRPGALREGKIQPKPMANIPAGLDRMMTFSMDNIHAAAGVNLEVLGMANREQAGVLEHQRKQAGLTILAGLFNALRKYRKEQGRVLLYFIQEYISDGRLIRAVGQNGQEKYLPLAKQADTAKYDVIVDESPTSPNMKEKVFATLSDLLPTLTKMGIPMPPELLDYAPIPSVLAQKWKELLENAGNPEQMQEAIQDLQQQLEKLAQENAQLKDKREQAMAEHQLKVDEAQLDAQIEKQNLELKREQMEAEHALKVQEFQFERQLELDKAQHEQEIAEIKAATDIQRKDFEAQRKAERETNQARTK